MKMAFVNIDLKTSQEETGERRKRVSDKKNIKMGEVTPNMVIVTFNVNSLHNPTQRV